MRQSLEGQPKIGSGVTAEVYAWGDGRALKLFESRVPRAKVQREFKVTQAVRNLGLPVPQAYEMVEIGDRCGIVFERIHGPSMLGLVESKPWRLFAGARQLAGLHASIHARTASLEMPSQRTQIQGWITDAKELSAEEMLAARRGLERLPEGDAVCHGDFHPGNIILAAQGPVIIDWSTGTRGHPLADVARTSWLFQHASLPPSAPWHTRLLIKHFRALLHDIYLRRYFRLRPGNRRELETWWPVQVAASAAWKATRWAAEDGPVPPMEDSAKT